VATVDFRLEADRRPLAAEMLGAAIIQDLVAISQERQRGVHRPALVIIDEFSAVGAPQTKRLFGRGRGRWLSQLLGPRKRAQTSCGVAVSYGADRALASDPLGDRHVCTSSWTSDSSVATDSSTTTAGC
jgi:hypothetical protein